VRVSLPYYANDDDVEFLLSAIEFVADHGRDFVPLYRLGWHDGVWRHIERPTPDVEPLELTVAALEEASQTFAVGDHEAPMSERELAAERTGYFGAARALAAELREKWQHAPPRFNPPTGDPEIDAQVWFDYVHTEGMP
jgi:hypothetical protein